MSNQKKSPSQNKPVSSRREFMQKSLKGAEAIAIGVFSVTFINGCSSPSQPNYSNNDDPPAQTDTVLTINITVSANQPLATVGGVISLGSSIIDETGIFVVRTSNTSVIAFSRKCTHQGCLLPSMTGSTVTCLCHGSTFDDSGNVVNGPANSPLKQYNATISGNIITISA